MKMSTVICGSINPEELCTDRGELAARLRMPKDAAAEFASEYVNNFLKIIKPRYCYAKTSVFVNNDGVAELGFAKIPSYSLEKLFSGCSSAYVAAVTLGIDADIYINRLGITSGAGSFVADAVASSLGEAAMDYVNTLLEKEANLTRRFSPGFGDFELKWQESVLGFLRADNHIGIKLGANYVMSPRKSITAIMGVIDK